jgi:colanic acid biosynthesis glycosyl transferase WcaI
LTATVAVLTSNFWPEQTGSSQTVSEFARYLAQSGVSVRVATSMPYYPEWEIRPEFRGKVWSVEDVDGMRIYRSWHRVRRAPTTVTRLLHEITLSLFALPNIVRALRKVDLAYIVSPALTFAFAGALLAWALGVKRILVVKDVMPDAAVELGMLRSRVMIGLSTWLARRLYSLADEIHTLSNGMRRRIARYVTPEKIRVVPDTIDVNELKPVPTSCNEFRTRFVPEGTFAVLHTGNMGKKQDLHLLLRTAERLRNERAIRFYVFGDGAMKDEFLALRDQRGLDNVAHYPLQDRRMLAHMLSGADVVVVSQLREVVDIVVPSKLVTALGAGSMIVAACSENSETARVINESDGGVRIGAGDDEALAGTLLKIRAGSLDTNGYRARARDYAVKTFERDQVYRPLVRDCQELGQRASRSASKASGGEPQQIGVRE